jgi:hypothetical protein
MVNKNNASKFSRLKACQTALLYCGFRNSTRTVPGSCGHDTRHSRAQPACRARTRRLLPSGFPIPDCSSPIPPRSVGRTLGIFKAALFYAPWVINIVPPPNYTRLISRLVVFEIDGYYTAISSQSSDKLDSRNGPRKTTPRFHLA